MTQLAYEREILRMISIIFSPQEILFRDAYTLFYKNVVFPAQAEYSYFTADFRLKIFLYYSKIIAYDISVLECIAVLITSVRCVSASAGF